MKEEHVLKSFVRKKYKNSTTSKDEKDPVLSNLVTGLLSQKESYSHLESMEREKTKRWKGSRSRSRNREILFVPKTTKNMNLNQILTIKREEEDKPHFRKQAYKKMKAIFEPSDESGRNLARRVALGIESRINLTYHYTGEEYVIVLKQLLDKFRAN